MLSWLTSGWLPTSWFPSLKSSCSPSWISGMEMMRIMIPSYSGSHLQTQAWRIMTILIQWGELKERMAKISRSHRQSPLQSLRSAGRRRPPLHSNYVRTNESSEVFDLLCELEQSSSLMDFIWRFKIQHSCVCLFFFFSNGKGSVKDGVTFRAYCPLLSLIKCIGSFCFVFQAQQNNFFMYSLSVFAPKLIIHDNLRQGYNHRRATLWVLCLDELLAYFNNIKLHWHELWQSLFFNFGIINIS